MAAATNLLIGLLILGAGGGHPSPSPSVGLVIPDFSVPHIKLGDRLLKEGNLKEAQKEYELALMIKPESPLANFQMAALQERLAQNNLALKYYRLAVRYKDVSFAKGDIDKAESKAKRGDFKGAFKLFRTVFHIQPQAGKALNEGVALQQQGDLDAAVKKFKEAIKLDARYLDAHYKLGAALLKKEKPFDALEAFEKALKIDGQDAETNLALGITYQKIGPLKPKGDRFADINAITDKKAREAKWRQLTLTRAIDHYRRAQPQMSGHFILHYNLGLALLNRRAKGDLPMAVKAFQRATQIKPKDVDSWVDLGTAHGLMGGMAHLNEAIRCYRKAMQIDDKRQDLHYQMAICWYQKGLIRPDANHLEITKENADMYYAHGSKYHRTDMFNHAAEHFEAYLKGNPRAANRKEVEEYLVMLKRETSRTVH